jgi:hypothetical protein
MKLKDKFKKWYRGTYYPPSEYEKFLHSRHSTLPAMGHYNPPFLAKILNGIGRFWLKYWQWCITTAVAIIFGSIMAYLTYLKLSKP